MSMNRLALLLVNKTVFELEDIMPIDEMPYIESYQTAYIKHSDNTWFTLVLSHASFATCHMRTV